MSSSVETFTPFCPICQADFMLSTEDAYRLACNHIVCSICLSKLTLVENNTVRCYFDGSITVYQCVRPLTGFSSFLKKIYASNPSIRSGLAAVEEAMRTSFNLSFNYSNIPCKYRSCARYRWCPYDHTYRFYKKTDCPFESLCPNANMCIFVHPCEKTFISLPLTPRPGNFSYMQQMPLSTPTGYNAMYDTTTTNQSSASPNPNPSLQLGSSAFPTMPEYQASVYYLCPNCQCYSTTCNCKNFYCL